MLSALSDVESKVRCLELGAADYLTKPFALAELVARVWARLRHAGPESGDGLLRAGGLTLDPHRRTADAGDGPVSLSAREFLLLKHLLLNEGEVCTRAELLEEVWGCSFDPGTNVVDVYIRRLRAKLGADVVETVRHAGYSPPVIARRWPELLWAAFAAVNVAVMVVLARLADGPVPLRLGQPDDPLRLPRLEPAATALVLLVVGSTTGYALLRTAQSTGEGLDEMTEVPLMGAMFLAMVWHARRREAALAEARAAAERERDFIRDASHLLRTPITVARGHAELARRDAPTARPRDDVDVVVGELRAAVAHLRPAARARRGRRTRTSPACAPSACPRWSPRRASAGARPPTATWACDDARRRHRARPTRSAWSAPSTR